MGSPSSHMPSTWNSMASRISSSSSSRVLAVATHPGRSRHVSCVVVGRLFNDYGVLHGSACSFSPDCFNMLFQVPGGRSSPGLPGMVTRPGLTGCLYWRWLPLVRTNRHPSFSISSIASLTLGMVRLSPPQTPGVLGFPQWRRPTGVPRPAAPSIERRGAPSSPRRVRRRPPPPPRLRSGRG